MVGCVGACLGCVVVYVGKRYWGAGTDARNYI